MTTVEHGKNSHPAPAAPKRPVDRPPGFRPSPTPRPMTGPPPGAPSGPGQGPGPVSGESGAERSGRSVSMVPLVGPVEGPVQATTAVARPGVETTTVVDRSRVRQAPPREQGPSRDQGQPREQGPGGSGPLRDPQAPAERATVATPLPERTTVATPVPGTAQAPGTTPGSGTTPAPGSQRPAAGSREHVLNRVDGPGAATAVVRVAPPAENRTARPVEGRGAPSAGSRTAPPAEATGGCPVTGHGRSGGHPPPPGVADERDPAPVDPAVAEEFLRQVYAETEPGVPLPERLRQVRAEIDRVGTYTHTTHELVFGTRVAWRNSARCIGRLYWQSLQVRDLRHLNDPADIAQESVGHLRAATRGGKIRSTMTVFAPDAPGRPGPRIRNDQLVRYAGHRNPDGTVTGDPGQADFTDHVVGMGWPRPQPAGRFDVLPLLITGPDGRSRLFDVPPDAVHEVPLRHPEHPWFARLGLRWHSVPAISNMPLEIGGVVYPAAPFNGWYLDTEVGARNLADTDRYDLLPEIAKRLGLDTRSVRTMWRDRAMVELVRAVTYSFDADGVTMADHHSEAERFMTFLAKEEAAGRRCPADWSWIVPPMSGSQTPVFHRYYDEPDPDLRPAFLEPHGLRPRDDQG